MQTIHREYHKWWSPRLNREMELLIFGHAGTKVLVFPTRSGRFYEYEHLRMPLVLRDKLESGSLQLFCLDSLDAESFYCWWAHPSGRILRHIQFEDYVLNEVFPFMAARNSHENIIAHGCSLGAFHAVNIAFRHPGLFCKLVAFSGRYDLTLSVENFRDLFDGYYDENIYYHTPAHFLPNLACERLLGQLRRLEIVLTIGESDPFLAHNRQFSQALMAKDIDHSLHVWQDRAHSGYYWRRMAPLYL